MAGQIGTAQIGGCFFLQGVSWGSGCGAHPPLKYRSCKARGEGVGSDEDPYLKWQFPQTTHVSQIPPALHSDLSQKFHHFHSLSEIHDFSSPSPACKASVLNCLALWPPSETHLPKNNLNHLHIFSAVVCDISWACLTLVVSKSLLISHLPTGVLLTDPSFLIPTSWNPLAPSSPSSLTTRSAAALKRNFCLHCQKAFSHLWLQRKTFFKYSLSQLQEILRGLFSDLHNEIGQIR